MKKIKLIIVFSLLITATIAQNTLKVMTYNLRFGELASLEEMATYIGEQQPDIVALQECDWKTYRERAIKQNGKAFVNELAYHTEMFGLYGKAINYRRGYYGVGILSKYPIVRSERVFLPNPSPKKEQRVLLMADIELPDGSIVTFVSTHLEVSTPYHRENQIKFINKQIKKIKTPIILAGDLNAIPSSEEIQNGFKKWFNATNEAFTFSTTKPEIKIDYIYGYPAKRFELVETRVDTTCLLSDHFPVISEIIIK